MSVETDLAALLDGLAPGGVWPNANVAATVAYPYLTYIVVGSVSYGTTSEEVAGLERKRIQIDAHGETYADAFNLAVAVNDVMPAAPFKNEKLEEHDLPYDSKTKTFTRITDYYCWTR